LLFFTKGRKTERIWYYDLSGVKVGKKTPMTLAHFGWSKSFEVLADAELPDTLAAEWLDNEQTAAREEGRARRPFPSFARLLGQRGTPEGESDFSWTVDFAARRTKAAGEMAPHLAEVAELREKAVALKEQAAALKKAGGDDAALRACRDELLTTEKAIREAQARADAIDAATFDLKAVNPRARVERDLRSPAEILDSIARHGQVVEEALQRLRELTKNATGV
ncbi:MAG: hypothetical protein RLZZ220_1117, partial [Pseudomonadota bacterium]